MFDRRHQFKSSFGAFTSQQRELARSRARRDERDAADAVSRTSTEGQPEDATSDATGADATDAQPAGSGASIAS